MKELAFPNLEGLAIHRHLHFAVDHENILLNVTVVGLSMEDRTRIDFNIECLKRLLRPEGDHGIDTEVRRSSGQGLLIAKGPHLRLDSRFPEQGRKRDAQPVYNFPDGRNGGARKSGLDLAQHALADAGQLGQSIEGQVPLLPNGPQVVGIPNLVKSKYGHTLCRDITASWQKKWLCREHALHCREIITDAGVCGPKG